MQIREHAQASPDKPAVILYPSGKVVTFGEMEARANRLAHLFRRAGLRDPMALLVLEWSLRLRFWSRIAFLVRGRT